MSDVRVRPAGAPTTLAEVARLAGVSVATASKALTGRHHVASATRQRVIEAAEKLAFTPNQSARNLLEGRTGTVGLLASDLEGRFMIPVLAGAEDAFGTGSINVFLCDARGDAVREQHHLRALLNRRVDGIIVVGDTTDPRPSLGKQLPVPVVYAYAPSDDPTDTSVVPDNVGGGRLAVDHLIAVGRRRIAHISGERSYAAARDRALGFEAGMSAAGLEPVREPLFGPWTERWGRDATTILMRSHPEVDGIVAGSDQIARGALDTLRDLGRTVPEDISVIGYDNWAVLAANARPELTSIDSDLQEVGRIAAMRIFEAIDGVAPPSSIEAQPARLVMRSSTIG